MTEEPLFEPVPESHVGRVRCRICGANGFDTDGRGWQRACLRGHTPCPDCGTPLTLKLDGTPRKHHLTHCLAAQFSQTPIDVPESHEHHFIPRRVRGGPRHQQELVCIYCKKTEKEIRGDQ